LLRHELSPMQKRLIGLLIFHGGEKAHRGGCCEKICEMAKSG
jgi:hypothetical protein